MSKLHIKNVHVIPWKKMEKEQIHKMTLCQFIDQIYSFETFP